LRKFVLLIGIVFSACQTSNATPIDPANAVYNVERRAVTLSKGLADSATALSSPPS
jgi:hypothetical protein